MKSVAGLLFCLVLVLAARQTDKIDSLVTQPIESFAPTIVVDDSDVFCKTYMGFVKDNAQEMQLLTMNIVTTKLQQDTLYFSYKLQSSRGSSHGTGKIHLINARIVVPYLPEGRVTMPQNGKIVFESINENNTPYWKLKEM